MSGFFEIEAEESEEEEEEYDENEKKKLKMMKKKSHIQDSSEEEDEDEEGECAVCHSRASILLAPFVFFLLSLLLIFCFNYSFILLHFSLFLVFLLY